MKTIRIDADALAASTAEPRGPTVAARDGDSKWLFTDRMDRDPIVIGSGVLLARIAQRGQAKGVGGGSRRLCATDIHSELGLSAVIECLWAGGLVFSNGTFEDDVTSIALYNADHLLVDASMAASYLRIFDKTSQISARLRA